MRDELVTLLLAGHETTASTLELDAAPGRAGTRRSGERLHEEAVEVFGDRPPVYEDLHRLHVHARWCCRRPCGCTRRCGCCRGERVADDEVGGYHVPAGADVLICPYTLHRHPRFWPEPERFDPERFAPDAPADRPRYAYIPFGAGPRFCVGNHLGMMEATFVISTLRARSAAGARARHRGRARADDVAAARAAACR